MITAKFGGSSLATGKDFLNVKNIIESDKERKVIIVSAPGKRFDKDIKITDLLLKCYNSRLQKKEFEKTFSEVESRFLEIAEFLNLSEFIIPFIKKIKDEILTFSEDFALSRGEYLSAVIMSKLLGFKFADAKDTVFFLPGGKISEEKTKNALLKYFELYKYMVIPGFYGTSSEGKIKTFPRGGSDITGSLVSSLLNASLYENWTDVNGMLLTSPELFKDSRKTDFLSLSELELLSSLGAKVFNRYAVPPLKKYAVPLEIKNSFAPYLKGTKVMPSLSSSDYLTGLSFLRSDGEDFKYIKEFFGLPAFRNHGVFIFITGKCIYDVLFISYILNLTGNSGINILSVNIDFRRNAFYFSVCENNYLEALSIIYKEINYRKDGPYERI